MPPGESKTARCAQTDRSQYALNLTLASLAGQVGCLTLVIIVVALLGGLWLDNWLKTRPIFTLLLVIGSMPIALFIMYRVALSAIARIKPAAKGPPAKEEKSG
ncbi:MAG: AtpZ/AtpI family protein [Anaerolineales bacterium]